MSISVIKKCKSTAFLLLTLYNLCWTQNQSNRFFSSGSEIVIDVLPENDIFYSHPCGEGISIYSLAEVFQVNEEVVMKSNKIHPKNPNCNGKIVKIPINRSKIIQNPPTKKNYNYLTLQYVVKKGDNLFRISKEYFKLDLQQLKAWNHKTTNDIQLGEKLTVGWYQIYTPNQKMDTKDTKKTIKPSPVISQPETPIEEIPANAIVKYYLSDVIGFWDKDASNNKSHYVLHNEAKPGTIMDIYNPMLRKHIKGKVLGKIPSGTYADDVQLIINGTAARELGILDRRFKVNIKYEM